MLNEFFEVRKGHKHQHFPSISKRLGDVLERGVCNTPHPSCHSVTGPSDTEGGIAAHEPRQCAFGLLNRKVLEKNHCGQQLQTVGQLKVLTLILKPGLITKGFMSS